MRKEESKNRPGKDAGLFLCAGPRPPMAVDTMTVSSRRLTAGEQPGGMMEWLNFQKGDTVTNMLSFCTSGKQHMNDE